MSDRPKLGVIVTNRNFFADSLVEEGRSQVLDALEKLGVDAVIVTPEETPLGVVESWEDAKKCGALFWLQTLSSRRSMPLNRKLLKSSITLVRIFTLKISSTA